MVFLWTSSSMYIIHMCIYYCYCIIVRYYYLSAPLPTVLSVPVSWWRRLTRPVGGRCGHGSWGISPVRPGHDPSGWISVLYRVRGQSVIMDSGLVNTCYIQYTITYCSTYWLQAILLIVELDNTDCLVLSCFVVHSYSCTHLWLPVLSLCSSKSNVCSLPTHTHTHIHSPYNTRTVYSIMLCLAHH